MQLNRKQINPKQTWDKQNRYSLRKLSVGLVSVATSAVFFMNAGSVLAADNSVPVGETSSSSSTHTGTEGSNESSTANEARKDPEVTPVDAKLAKTGSVTVKYVDPMNNTVGSTTLEGQEDKDYSSAVQSNIPSGYLLGDHQIPAGTFSKDGSTITVEVNPAPANTRGTATINYVDESGATVKTITATGFVGDRIDAGSYLPDRYTIAEKDQTSASGKLFEDSPATITVYVKPGSNQDLKNSNTKNTPSEDGTELPLSDGTAEGLREKVVGLTKDQYANNKISITNIQFNKDEVKDYDPAIVDPEDPSKNVQAPMDLQVTFDWEGIGLRKGDVLVTPMSDAFDSTVRLPLEKFSSASISDMGIIVLDYDKRKMYVEFRKDLDPSKVYHGSIKLGTFINRNYFTKLDNDKTLNIPTPNGDIVQKHLTVTYQDAPNYDNAYMQAIAQKMSKDETSSDVTWAVEVNPISKNSNDNKIGKNNMAYASIYITPNEINGVYPEYDGSGNVDATRPSYSESDLPVELVGGIDSFKVYEAEISPSMGYKKLKELKRDVDYEVLDSNDPETPLDNYNDDTKQTSHAKNVYVINLKGDYTVTNKKFVVEYTTHHSNLVYDHGNDRGSSETQVRLYSLVTYTHANDQNQIERTYNRNEGRITEAFDGDIIGASVNVISSTVDTTGTTTDLRGSVVVTHVDATTGRVLKADGYAIDADGKEMRNVLVGTHYTTNPEYFDGYKFTSIAYDSDNPDGEVEQGVKHVIYQYVPVAAKGNVDVTYVTEDGKVLKATQLVFQDSQEVGTAYKTDQKEFTGYHFVRMGEFSAKATGEVTENLQHVVYVYKADPVQKKGSVDVKYVTKDGKVLEDTSVVKNNAPVGEDYSTKEKSFDGYHFVGMDKTSDPATGVVAEGTKHVIYVYEKNQEKGTVIVHFVDEDGNKISDDVVNKKDVPTGEDYTTTPKDIPGYELDKNKIPSNKDGVVVKGTTEVTYVYHTETKKGNVDVTYVAEDGTVLEKTANVFTEAQEVGTDYSTEKKNFDGYHFVRMGEFSADASGKVTENLQHVIYVYAKDKKGSVDVKYITTDGKVLEDVSVVKDNAPVGEEYTTEEKSFDGYHFVGMDKTSDPASGKVAEGEKHVIFVYEKNQEKGTVIVHFVDEDGNKISDDVVNKKDVPTGEDYTTTPKDIPGYELDKNKIPSNKDGVVVKGTTEVTYVYHKTPEPTPTPNQPEKPSDETPNQPGQPTTKTPNQPEEPSTDTPNKPEEPSNENPTPEVPEDNTTTEKLVLKTHHKKTNKQTTISHNSHETVNNNSSVTKVNNSKARLPQTGEKANNAASLAGVTLLAGATALAVGMIMSKKKH